LQEVSSIEPPAYIDINTWRSLQELDEIDKGCNIIQSFFSEEPFWKVFLVDQNPYEIKYPQNLFINNFIKLLLIKILR
jgi:hypothetical protein